METEEINAGDTVYLKSGGPAMTVIYKDGGGLCHVSWAMQGGPIARDAFPQACVTKKRPYSKGS